MKKISIIDFKNFGKLFIKSFNAWDKDEPFRLSAVVAYYALFSLPALLVLIVNVAGSVFGEQAVQGEISSEISNMLGKDTAEQIETMIKNVSESKQSTLATIVSIGTLLFGATGAFFHLQKSLNVVWKVRQEPKNMFFRMLLDRATSLGLIIIIGLLLLISLILTTAISVLNEWIRNTLPDFLLYIVFVINFLLSFGVITVLFAIIFKVLPDIKIPWRIVWMGAAITAALFVVAKFALGLYFSEAEPGSTYGAAGSVVLILLWVSYVVMILLFGAEFTKVYADHHNIETKTTSYAVKYKKEEKVI